MKAPNAIIIHPLLHCVVGCRLQTMNSSLPPIYQAPSTASLYYTMRVTVHNGRTFVGPAYELHNLVHLDVPGWKVLQVRAWSFVLQHMHVNRAFIPGPGCGLGQGHYMGVFTPSCPCCQVPPSYGLAVSAMRWRFGI